MPLIQNEEGALLGVDGALASSTDCCKCKCRFRFYTSNGGVVAAWKDNTTRPSIGGGRDKVYTVDLGKTMDTSFFIYGYYQEGLGVRSVFDGWYLNNETKITSTEPGKWQVSTIAGSYWPPLPNDRASPVLWDEKNNSIRVTCPEDGSLTTADFVARMTSPYCVIIFKATEGGSVTNGDKEIRVTSSNQQAVSSTASPDSGYKFLGWYASSNAGESNKLLTTNLTVQAGCLRDPYYDSSIRSGPVKRTITAKFAKICGTVTFTYEKPAGWADVDVYPAGTVSVGEGETVSSYARYTPQYSDPYKFSFLGWFKGEDRITTSGTVKYTCDPDEDNVTLVAKWGRQCTLSVTYTYYTDCGSPSVSSDAGTKEGSMLYVPCDNPVTLSGSYSSGSSCTNGGVWYVDGVEAGTGKSFTYTPSLGIEATRIRWDITGDGCTCTNSGSGSGSGGVTGCVCKNKARPKWKLLYHSKGTYNYEVCDCGCDCTTHKVTITEDCRWTSGCYYPSTWDECVSSSKSPGAGWVHPWPNSPYACGY